MHIGRKIILTDVPSPQYSGATYNIIILATLILLFPRCCSPVSSFSSSPAMRVLSPSLWPLLGVRFPRVGVFTQAEACKAPSRVSLLELCYRQQSPELTLCIVCRLHCRKKSHVQLSPLAPHLSKELRKVQRVMRIQRSGETFPGTGKEFHV